MLYYFVLVIFLALLGRATATENRPYTYTTHGIQKRFATPCTTPNNDDGVCVEVQRCSIFMQALASGKSETFDFIRKSRCGPRNEDPRQPKVCCGKYDNYLDKVIATKRPAKVRKNPLSNICKNYTLLAPSRIFGGTVASLREFPWMARLKHRQLDGGIKYGCSGFLVSEYFVLTAAHCIVSKEPFMREVVLGEHNAETDPDCEDSEGIVECADSPQVLKTAEPIVHPGYTNDKQRYNDIAVIPLEEPAELTDYVHPICLSKKLPQQNEMWLSGWGQTESGNPSPIKLKVSVPRADREVCAEKYRSQRIDILETQLCAGGEANQDSCSGDSGGPIMVQKGTGPWFAEGIVSFGVGCGRRGWPGVYTNIPSYLPWIRRVAKRYLKERVER